MKLTAKQHRNIANGIDRIRNSLIILFVLFLFSSCLKRHRDNRGVYIYGDSCIKSHDELYSGITHVNGMAIPESYTVTHCDSSKTVKIYLGK